MTDNVLRLKDAVSKLRIEYPDRMSMVDTAQQLRERFYQGLKQEVHQSLTPSYQDPPVAYLFFIPKEKGVRDYKTHLEDVIGSMKVLKIEIRQNQI